MQVVPGLKAEVPVCGMETHLSILTKEEIDRLKAEVPVCGMETPRFVQQTHSLLHG